ncbi:MAG: ABC-F family ATP-binding cassette domain-containing protein [Oscillospiraceae bacterium]|jgi:ATP-binding cassette subfamily F protein 3|nr:ABC-F family ATP-binding cassette domain-containing protein [Oscillospiraceae bacterium]
MAILTLQSLCMGFEDRVLFTDVQLLLAQGQRLALVGANGCGKTTLLRLIAGEYTPESGAVVLGKGVRLGYARQEAGEDGEQSENSGSVYDEALAVFAPLAALEAELQTIHDSLLTAQSEQLLHRQAELREQYEQAGGLTYQARTRSALAGLGFSAAEQALPVCLLSGGQRAKLRLGRLLLSGADLLLLDEPTNHLDLDAIAWLEGFLGEYRGAVILVSHDRYFLDRVATHTAELRHGRLTLRKGGYSEALRRREAQALLDAKHYENQTEEIRRIEAMILQQRQFGQAHNFKTIASKEKQMERLRAELVAPEGQLRQLRFRFPPVPETGGEVLRLRGLCKAYGEKKLFTNVECLIEKGERVFLLGPNGCGKTTLLNILRRKCKPDAGYAAWGANVCPGSYDQTLALAPELREATVLDSLWDLHRGMTQTEIRSLLGAFLFSGEEVFRPLGCLSGGERARLELLKLLLSGANVLLLDEPTNHLDIASREALENALLTFGGTVLAVSHDRYFISKLATKLYRLTPGGLEYCGKSYQEYEQALAVSHMAHSAAPEETGRGKPGGNGYLRKKEAASAERRRATALARCEAEIARLESEVKAAEAALTAPDAAADYEKLPALTAVLEQAQTALQERYTEWENLY